MKKLIKAWLGIKEPTKPTEQIDIQAARFLIGQALADALDGREDFEERWGLSKYVVVNLLERRISAAAGRYGKDAAEKEIKEHINAEAFIDSVIDRIKRKQLNP